MAPDYDKWLDSADPYNSVLKTVHKCENCEDDIYEGDSFIEWDGKYICWNCVESFREEAVVEEPDSF